MENIKSPHPHTLPEPVCKVWNSRKSVFRACGIGAVIGIIIIFGTPKEYTADILIAPENARRGSSQSMGALAALTDAGRNSSIAERDAVYPSLYPVIVHSTPFLIRLFDVKVREQKDSTAMTLARYVKERQKAPWWSVAASAPLRLTSRVLPLFGSTPDGEGKKENRKTDIFRLTPEETRIANAIASGITIGIDQKKRTVTVSVTMQDPLVAAIVADTVQAYLHEYVTEYRTGKTRRFLKYAEQLRDEARTEYREAQTRYAGYADAHRDLTMLIARAELARLRNEMNLANSAYIRMEQQVRTARIKVRKVTPINTIIQPAQVPLSPSKPRKMVILAACILLGGAGSAAWILFVEDFIRNIKKRITNARMQADDKKDDSAAV